MKKLWMVGLAMLAGVAVAGDVVITNYIPGYVWVPETFTNAGDSGLSVSNGYLCVPLDALSGVTTNDAASAAGDIRAVVDGILDRVWKGYAANTNKPSQLAVVRAVSASSVNTNIYVTVRYTVDVNKDVGAGVADE